MADRTDRERIGALGRGVDAWHPGNPIDHHRQLVQVYDGGSIPTTVPNVFLTRPVVMSFVESEGESWSAAVDSSESIPVLVLGTGIPAAGDLLVAHAVGGRWVAGGSGGEDSHECRGCTYPATLTLSWDGPLAGSQTLNFDGDNGYAMQWKTECFNLGTPNQSAIFRFTCDYSGDFVDLLPGIVSSTTIPCYGTPFSCSPSPVLIGESCGPIHHQWQVDATNCNPTCRWLRTGNIAGVGCAGGTVNIYVDE